MNQYGENNYYVRVVSMNNDGSFDLQREMGFEDLNEARAAYEKADYCQPFTDKYLLDIENNEVLEATNEELF